MSGTDAPSTLFADLFAPVAEFLISSIANSALGVFDKENGWHCGMGESLSIEYALRKGHTTKRCR